MLANYFHSHVLRINGHNSEHGILMSARELDCLKWTAAGKTAWEASVILGISERTVRFHLNTAGVISSLALLGMIGKGWLIRAVHFDVAAAMHSHVPCATRARLRQ